MEGTTVCSRKLEGSWYGVTAGGNWKHPSWRDNKQYILKLTQATNISITVTQRPLPGKDQTVHPIGLYVLKFPAPLGGTLGKTATEKMQEGQPTRRILHISRKEVKAVSDFNEKESVSLRANLEPTVTPLVILPTTRDPGQECCFTLEVTGDYPFELSEVSAEDDWKSARGFGEWTPANSGGCRHNSSWRNNMQWRLWIPKTSFVTMILSQEVPDDDPDDMDFEFNSIGFYCAKTSETQRKKYTMWDGDIVVKTKWESRRTVWTEAILKNNENTPYIIIPTTFDAGETGKYTLVIYSNNPCTMELIDEDTDRWLEQSILGKWEGPSAGGGRIYSSWKNNPQYHIILSENAEKETNAIVLVTQQEGASPCDIESHLSTIGLYIIKPNGGPRRCIQLTSENVLRTSRFEASFEVALKIKLPPSQHPYILVPCTSEPGY